MRRFARRLGPLFALLIPALVAMFVTLFAAPAPLARVAGPVQAAGVIHAYDVPIHNAPGHGDLPERGPPAWAHDYTAYDAVGSCSHGTSVCSDSSTAGASDTYTNPSMPARAFVATPTTGAQVVVTVGKFSSFPQAHVAANGAAKIPLGPGAEDAWKVLNRVDAKGAPLPGYKGGKTFLNDRSQGAARLPEGPTYREWDLTQKVKGVDRDGRRLVTGSDGSAYDTTDHYVSFVQIR